MIHVGESDTLRTTRGNDDLVSCSLVHLFFFLPFSKNNLDHSWMPRSCVIWQVAARESSI